MAQESISAISAVEPDRSITSAAPVTQTAARPEVARSSDALAGQERAAQAQAAAASQTDVHLRFQVDEKTNDLTVFVVDRASQKVIRTIPPDEVNKLNAGDLVQLLA